VDADARRERQPGERRVVAEREADRVGDASKRRKKPSVRSISRPPWRATRSRACRSCAAQVARAAASPSLASSAVLSTMSVNTSARSTIGSIVPASAARLRSCAVRDLQVAGLSLRSLRLSTSSLLIGAFRLIPLGGIGDWNHFL
jgi:hypothetical protein